MTEFNLPRRRALFYICLILFFQLASSLLIGQVWSSHKNTFANNGNWLLTKLTLARPVMGVENYFGGTQTLNRYHLDLGAWHGFQEVLCKDPISPRSMEFRFFLPQYAYFYVLFNKNEKGFSGIRISTSSFYGSMYFSAQNNGKFIEQSSLQLDRLKVDSWNSCRIQFSSAAVTFELNGQFVRSFPLATKYPQFLGFRGSSGNVLIDDVLILSDDGKLVFKESFFNLRSFLVSTLVCFLCLTAILAAGLAFLVRIQGSTRTVALQMAGLASFLVFLSSAIVCVYNFNHLGSYPNLLPPRFRAFKKEVDWREKELQRMDDEIRSDYGREEAEGLFRVLFLGTSQTWGSGVSENDDTFVRRIEKMLAHSRNGAVRYECINAGVRGSHSAALLSYYEKSWVNLKPRLVVVNLSQNNTFYSKDDVDFGADLQKIIDINKRNKIETVFILEAISPEYNRKAIKSMHAIMRQVAKKNGILVLNAYEYFFNKRDDGLIWWDIVHMTSFGYELMADYIYGNIRPMLKTLLNSTDRAQRAS